jgi:hypothetical protein
MEEHYERTTTQVASTAGGLLAQTVPVSPAGLVSSGRLTGLQALRDQARINRVKISLRPMRGTDSEGLCCLYIERDPTAAVVATTALACDQFERAIGQAWNSVVLEWRPQQPTDLVFGLLNPGTSVLANIFLVGTGFEASYNAYEMIVEAWFTLRGRP